MDTVDFIKWYLVFIFSTSLLLGAFNLLPLPPLDGASLPLLFAGRGLADNIFALTRHPTLRTVGMLVAWRVFNAIHHPP